MGTSLPSALDDTDRVYRVGADVTELGDGPGSYNVQGNVWHLTYGRFLSLPLRPTLLIKSRLAREPDHRSGMVRLQRRAGLDQQRDL